MAPTRIPDAASSNVGVVNGITQTIEKTHAWPEDVRLGRIALIDKGEGPLATQQRPITVLPLLYRCAARPGGSAADVWYRMAVSIERAVLTNTHLHCATTARSLCNNCHQVRTPVLSTT